MDNVEAQSPVTSGSPPARPAPGLMARFVGVVTSPRATFEAVAADPRWLTMLLLLIAIGAVCLVGFMSTEVGRQAMVDQVEKGFDSTQRMMRGLGVEIPEAAREQTLAQYRDAPLWRLVIMPLVSMVIFTPLIVAATAGILFGAFAMFGGGARFKQVFAVVVHTGVIMSVQQLFVTPLNYLRESLDSATNLYVFVSGFVTEGTFVARLLGAIDLFRLWWILVLATGLAVLYRRKTAPIAWSLISVYGLFALIWAGVAAFLAARSGA
jgi:hypothetical protein